VPNTDPENEPENDPEKDPENEPVKSPFLAPRITTCSPNDPDFFMKAKPSYVLRAISPKSIEDVSGTFPGTELRRSFKYWLDMCL
jgi:hypothetical protein